MSVLDHLVIMDFDLLEDNLETTINRLVDTVLSEWQQEHDLKGEVEDMVMQTCIRCIIQKASCQSNTNNIISGLRNELEAFTKLLHGDMDNVIKLSLRWDESKLPDSCFNFINAAELSHLKKGEEEDLVKFFNNKISEIKREHEAKVHQITETCMSLKGKYLSERSLSLPPTKEFEALRRKIPEVVSKLDAILFLEEFILRENRHSLVAKEEEVKRLSSQLSVASDDTRIEASVVENVYKTVIGELNSQIQDTKEESELRIVAMQDIYDILLGVAASDCATEDGYMQQLLQHIVFKESLADVDQKFKNLHMEYIATNENLVSLENKAVELKSEGEERERLLAEEKETLNKKLDEISDKLLKAEEKLASDGMEISSLNQKLQEATEEIETSKNMFLALSEEKQSLLSLTQAKEEQHRKQVVVLLDELSTKFVDFQRRVTTDISNNNTRLENSRSQLSCLIKPANVLKTTLLQHKQKLQSKCSDLQMAEDEVDLLGDEVETQLGLLEKIYIALDHYSPVLQHYPGVIEILKLVRKELSGESLKAQ